MEYADLRFIAFAEQSIKWPEYIGQTLRGAFGLSLKALACQRKERRCEECPESLACAYAVLFEGAAPVNRAILRKYPQVPQPFVLVPAESTSEGLNKDGRLEFTIRLIGPAIEMYPYVIRAGMRMLQYGLGGKRVPFRLQAIHDSHGSIYTHGDPAVRAVHRQSLTLPPQPAPVIGRIMLKFLTPLRLAVDGRPSHDPSLEAILAAVVRRCRILNHFYGDGNELATPGELLDAAGAAERIDCALLSKNLRRFSGRQQRTMMLDGVLGTLTYKWPSGCAGPQHWLQLGSVLHVGKATTFGFGRIEATCEPT